MHHIPGCEFTLQSPSEEDQYFSLTIKLSEHHKRVFYIADTNEAN